MSFERSWPAVQPVAFTANGGQWGLVTVADVAGFRVKQSAYLTANGLPTLPVQVKVVLSPTTLIVGYVDNQMANWKKLNISAYTVAGNATIGAEWQQKNSITIQDIEKAVYEADPVVALRTVGVDQYGNPWTDANPLPIEFDGTIDIGKVEIIGPAPDNNQLEVNANGSINTISLAQLIPFEFNEIDLTNSVIAGQTVPTMVVYKQSGTTVATLTLGYDGNANLTSVVRT